MPICDVLLNSCTISGAGATLQQAFQIKNIAGTAADSGTGINKVEMSMKNTDISVKRWFNPVTNAFDKTTEYWFTTTGTTSWFFDTTAIL